MVAGNMSSTVIMMTTRTFVIVGVVNGGIGVATKMIHKIVNRLPMATCQTLLMIMTGSYLSFSLL